MEVVQVGRRLWRLVGLRLCLDFVARLLEVQVAGLLSVGGRVGGGRGEHRPGDENDLTCVIDNVSSLCGQSANFMSLCLLQICNLFVYTFCQSYAPGALGPWGDSRATTNTYSHMFLKLICDPGLKLDLTSYIFGVPSRLGCKIRDYLPTGWPGPR